MTRVNCALLAEAISGLARANYLTGYWDNKRNLMCKEFLADGNDRKTLKKEDPAYWYHKRNLILMDEEFPADGNDRKTLKEGDSFLEDFVMTEYHSRKNCEARCRHRTAIDKYFKLIVESANE